MMVRSWFLGQRGDSSGRLSGGRLDGIRLACWGRQEQKKNRGEKKKREGRKEDFWAAEDVRKRIRRERRKERYVFHESLNSFYRYIFLFLFFLDSVYGFFGYTFSFMVAIWSMNSLWLACLFSSGWFESNSALFLLHYTSWESFVFVLAPVECIRIHPPTAKPMDPSAKHRFVCLSCLVSWCPPFYFLVVSSPSPVSDVHLRGARQWI